MERKFLNISSWRAERKRRKGGRGILSVRSRRFRIQKFLKIDKSLLRILYEDRGKRAKDGKGPF